MGIRKNKILYCNMTIVCISHSYHQKYCNGLVRQWQRHSINHVGWNIIWCSSVAPPPPYGMTVIPHVLQIK